MKTLPPLDRRMYVIGVTLLLLLTLFGYYFWIYLPNQENLLVSKRIRALHRMAQNFEGKYQVYQKNADNIFLKKEFKEIDSLIRVNKVWLDSLRTSTHMPDQAICIQKEHLEPNQRKINDRRKRLYNDAINRDFRLILQQELKPSHQQNSITYAYQRPGDSLAHIMLATDMEGFFGPLERSESFDSYIVFKDKQVVYQTLAGGVILIPEQAFGTGEQVVDTDMSSEGRLKRYNLNEQKPEVFESGLNVKLASQDYKLFSSRLSASSDAVWTIYAFIGQERFNNEKQKVPFFLLLFLSLGLLCLIFALPFIKLLLISHIERLHSRDVVLSISSFVICTAILVLSITVMMTYQDQRGLIDDRLSVLADSLESGVYQEIIQTQALFDAYEAGMYVPPPSPQGRSEQSFNDIDIFTDHQLRRDLDKDLLKALRYYPFLKNLYWIDESGNFRFQFSTIIDSSRSSVEDFDYRGRAYVSEILAGKGWSFPGLDQPIYLQSISSWTTSEKAAVISRAAQGDSLYISSTRVEPVNVLAASVRFHDLIDPLLPPAYSFSILDKHGDVLFHSDKNRNLQENFLKETDHDNSIRSSMLSYTSDYTDISYGGKEQRALLRPMEHLPWFVATTYDKNYSQSPYLQSISMTVIIILLLGAMSSFYMFLLSLPQRRRTKLSKLTFHYDWLWPRARSQAGYVMLILLHIVLLLIILGLYGFLSLNVMQVTALFLYGMMASFFSGWWLLKERKQQTSLVIFLSMLLLTIIFVTNQLLTPEIWENLLMLFAIAIPFGVLMYRQRRYSRFSSVRNTASGQNYTLAYNSMLFSHLLISSVFSVICIFSTANDQELLIWKKYELYKINQAREERNQQMKALYKDRSLNNPQLSIASLAENEAVYHGNLGYQECSCPKLEYLTENRLDTLLYNSRPFFTGLFVDTQGFVLHHGEKNHWKASLCEQHGIRLTFRNPSVDHVTEKAMATVLPVFWKSVIWNEWYTVVAFLLLITLLYGLYRAVSYASFRFFAMDLFNFMEPISLDDEYLRSRFAQNHVDSRQANLLVVALPFAGVQQLYEGKDNIHVLNVSEFLEEGSLEGLDTQKGSNVVLENFSYSIDDVSKNKHRLQLLEKLLLHKNVITIISRFSPDQILEKYEEQVTKTTEADDRENLLVQIGRWKELMSGFTKIYYSIITDAKERKQLKSDCSLEEMIRYELSVNRRYFIRLKGSLIKSWEEQIVLSDTLKRVADSTDPDIKEEILVKIQSMAQPFYFSLWNTCSKEEKYLLYDLAMDGFVNTNNLRVIKKLMEKGLVFYDEALMVMNESFRNFILSTIKEAESLEMERELRRSGTWSIYSTVILLLVLGAILFVGFAHRSLVDQFVALLAGITAAVPYLLRLTGFFNSNTLAKNG